MGWGRGKEGADKGSKSAEAMELMKEALVKKLAENKWKRGADGEPKKMPAWAREDLGKQLSRRAREEWKKEGDWELSQDGPDQLVPPGRVLSHATLDNVRSSSRSSAQPTQLNSQSLPPKDPSARTALPPPGKTPAFRLRQKPFQHQ